MAGKSGRWNRCLFPIDDALIESLIDDYHARAEGLDLEEDTSDDDSAGGDDCLMWDLEQSLSDTAAPEADAESAEAAALDEAHAVNMRVLEDYLRRRSTGDPEPTDDPEPVVHTLH